MVDTQAAGHLHLVSHDPYDPGIGEDVRDRRRHMGLSVQQMGQPAGVTEQTWRHDEAGRTQVRGDEQEQVREALVRHLPTWEDRTPASPAPTTTSPARPRSPTAAPPSRTPTTVGNLTAPKGRQDRDESGRGDDDEHPPQGARACRPYVTQSDAAGGSAGERGRPRLVQEWVVLALVVWQVHRGPQQ